MRAKIQKWGNSQGLRLPKSILEEASISIGDDVEIIAREGQIMVRPARARRRYRLEDLVARMPADYQVEEEPFGKPVGREEW